MYRTAPKYPLKRI